MMTLADQLKEAQREVAVRKRVYPSLVERGRMTQGQADYHLAAMEAIVQTLGRLEAERSQPDLFASR
jgi:hypothetical protein